jgi:hypothetical protein
MMSVSDQQTGRSSNQQPITLHALILMRGFPLAGYVASEIYSLNRLLEPLVAHPALSLPRELN